MGEASFKFLILSRGYLAEESFREAEALAVQTGKSFLEVLIANGYVSKNQICLILDSVYGINYLDLSQAHITDEALKLLGYDVVMRYNLLPVSVNGGRLKVAMANPFNIESIDHVELITGLHVEPYLVFNKELQVFINKFYRNVQITNIASQFLVEESIKRNKYIIDDSLKAALQNAPAVRLIDSLIESAVLYSASDIHIEPFERVVRTRYRIDGMLKAFQEVDISLHNYIISRLKIMGGMDISEKRLPQDGHFKISFNEHKIDFRLSTVPTIFGEKAVIRLIYSEISWLDKLSLGFFEDDLQKIETYLERPHGAILITGPTGSGKTTTVSSFVGQINKEGVNVITIEEPVENIIFGVNQISVNSKIGLSFANTLRSILRQDPDVIMVGEIRDEETASISVRAAITGHLVLSTLHTNDAVSAIIRLIDMGVAGYLVMAAVKVIISQRLVRRVCPHCRIEEKCSEADYEILGLPMGATVFSGKGCEKCSNTGYFGRFAIYELLEIDEKIRALVQEGQSYEGVKAYLKEKKAPTMLDCARKNVLLGNTTVSEVYRAIFV